jgi:hypothetical protein
MVERTIDLRNHESLTRAEADRQTRTHAEKRTGVQRAHIAPTEPPHGKKYLLEWTAPEYQARERGPYWFLLPFGVALLFVIFGIVIHSYFFIAFVALALVVILLYGRRPPREYRFALAKEGIYVGETLYRFSELKSFWIFETAEPPELSLETSKLLHPYLRLPLGGLHPDKVRSVLSEFLPEQEHKEFITDQITRSIGF